MKIDNELTEACFHPEQPQPEQPRLKVLCPFCSAEQSADVLIEIDGIDAGCESCGDGQGAFGRVEVKCCSCDRVMYVKEFNTTTY